MNLLQEICGVLDEAAVVYAVKEVCSHKVIHIGDIAAVIPVHQCAESREEASQEAESLKLTVSQIISRTGIYPLTIAEDRWRSQHEMMRSRLLAHLRIFKQIYARNCIVRKIDKTTAAEFLAANHSYGDARCRYRYGLYLQRHTGHNAEQYEVDTTEGKILPETLVAVATFSNARRWVKGDKIIRSYEWTRYASLPGVRLSGGMGKLLKTFIEEVNPDDIMTYADLEWSEGKVYESLGFVLEGHKAAVDFIIDRLSWKRIAISGQTKEDGIYFQNLGSNKYRIKLTDYQ